jgi:hypothetical protein
LPLATTTDTLAFAPVIPGNTKYQVPAIVSTNLETARL